MDLNTLYTQAELIEYILNRREMSSRLNSIKSKMEKDYKVSPWMVLNKKNHIDNLLIKFMDTIIYKFYRDTNISNLSYEERYALDYSLVLEVLKRTGEVLKEVDRLYYDKYDDSNLKDISQL